VGFSLLELLTVMALLALLATFALPPRPDSGATATLNSEADRLSRLLRHGRHSGVALRQPVTLCPLDAKDRCHNAWDAPLTLFIDHPPKGQRQGPEDQILRRLPPAPPGLTRHWRAFGSRRYLRWRPDGRTDGQNGRLELIARGRTLTLIVTQAGRLRRGPKA
jgi:prepilin-type N-terminal cleavage/methylation domain